MFDEILLGLHGFTGDIVLEKNGRFEVVTCDIVNSSEMELLNCIVSLGKMY